MNFTRRRPQTGQQETCMWAFCYRQEPSPAWLTIAARNLVEHDILVQRHCSSRVYQGEHGAQQPAAENLHLDIRMGCSLRGARRKAMVASVMHGCRLLRPEGEADTTAMGCIVNASGIRGASQGQDAELHSQRDLQIANCSSGTRQQGQAHVRDVVLVVIEARDADRPDESELAQDPQQVDAVSHFAQKAAAAAPASLPPQAHEADTLGPQIARPQQIHNAACIQGLSIHKVIHFTRWQGGIDVSRC